MAASASAPGPSASRRARPAATASWPEPATGIGQTQADALIVVEVNCGGCHSLDYIRTNAPFMTAIVWEAEVSKMINAFGASIEPADAKTIIEYLSSTYGAPQS